MSNESMLRDIILSVSPRDLLEFPHLGEGISHFVTCDGPSWREGIRYEVYLYCKDEEPLLHIDKDCGYIFQGDGERRANGHIIGNFLCDEVRQTDIAAPVSIANESTFVISGNYEKNCGKMFFWHNFDDPSGIIIYTKPIEIAEFLREQCPRYNVGTCGDCHLAKWRDDSRQQEGFLGCDFSCTQPDVWCNAVFPSSPYLRYLLASAQHETG